ncbi:hypothetical protein ACFX2J_034932 [Malus domestica]
MNSAHSVLTIQLGDGGYDCSEFTSPSSHLHDDLSAVGSSSKTMQTPLVANSDWLESAGDIKAPGFNAKIVDENSKASFLLPTVTAAVPNKIPKDSFHLAYIFYFTLGLDYLLPWNAFITAVDYFAHLYPYASVDRIFSIVYIVVSLFCLLLIIFYSHKSEAYVRINVGLSFFVVSLIAVPHGCVLHQGSG